MQNTTEYSCPCCGRELGYDPESGKMLCQYCGNTYEVTMLEELQQIDSSNVTYDWGSFDADLKPSENPVYVCQSCGAALETDDNTIVYRCPYCDSEVLIKENITGGLRPNAIIPFKIQPKDLVNHLNNYYKDMKLLPDDFFENNVPENIQGVYIPYWLFNGTLDGTIVMNGTTANTSIQGDYEVTEVDHYLLSREGSLSFANVPADASKRMDDDFMKTIEPFDFSELVPFQSGYLPGFMAERFDQKAEEVGSQAESRMMNTVTDVFTSTAAGFNATIRANSMKLVKKEISYALMPVYRFQCNYRGQKYEYLINGQTGKVSGEVPIDPVKKRRSFWIPALIAAAVVIVITLIR